MFAGINLPVLTTNQNQESFTIINSTLYQGKMIINLEGTVVENIIQFNQCPVYFESSQYVHVNEIFIKWKNSTQNIYGYLESSLIDRNIVNINQQLLFFHQSMRSNYIFFAPTHRQQYKIQCSNLLSSVFKIHLSEQQEIEKIYLQLEITNARF